MPPVIAAVAAVGSAISAVGGVIGAAAFAGASAIGFSAAAAVAIGTAVTSLATMGIYAGLAAGVSKLAVAAGIMGKGTSAALSRLNITFDPLAARKMIVGTRTAMATDVLYSEPSGSEQEYVDYIICCAAHRGRVDEIWTDTTLLWSRAGGIASQYSGYAWVTAIDEGSAANAISINGGGVWSAADCWLIGCCYVHLRIKRTGNDKKASSPFASGLSGRMTVIGEGLRCYDPRMDSTAGGSGPQRADDQSTWVASDNTAVQMLTALLGWRIGGEISVGSGADPTRLRIADFAAGANICDEAVPLDAGGTQKRYESAGIFNDGMDAITICGVLGQSMVAELTEAHGRLGLRCMVNDLAGPLLELGPEDILGAVNYTGQNALHEAPNVVRGNFVDPSSASLYQMVPYVQASVPAVDGNERVLAMDFPITQDGIRARRIAARALARLQLGGTLIADFGPRAWALRPGDPLRLSFPALGLDRAYFRVKSATYRVVMDADGAKRFCPMELERDDPSVYAPPADAEPDAAIAPVDYDPANNMLLAVENAVTSQVPDGSAAVIVGTSSAIERLLQDGEGATVSGEAIVDDIAGPASTATATLTLYYSTDGTAWHAITSGSGNEPIPEPVSVSAGPDTVTNSTGGPLLYRFRAVLSLSSGVTGTARGGSSFFSVS